MKCLDCGAIGITGSACTDCGGTNLGEEAGNTSTTTAPDAQSAAQPLGLGAGGAVDMPAMDLQTDTKGPLVGTIVLPDGRSVPVHEGEVFTVAHQDTEQDVTHKVDDGSVSRTPIKIFARDGQMHVTGGGGNGYALVTTVRYKPDETQPIPRGVNISVTVGKNSKFRVK